jgi:negative regulator of flagellin synthesis FlgM
VKIDKRIPPTTPSKVSATGAKKVGKSDQAGKAAPAAADSLTLTESSSRLRALEGELAQVDVTDAGKVEAVKAALANGSFEVDAEVVADRLIDHTKETLRKRPRKK